MKNPRDQSQSPGRGESGPGPRNRAPAGRAGSGPARGKPPEPERAAEKPGFLDQLRQRLGQSGRSAAPADPRRPGSLDELDGAESEAGDLVRRFAASSPTSKKPAGRDDEDD